jgi:hypothetical protein
VSHQQQQHICRPISSPHTAKQRHTPGSLGTVRMASRLAVKAAAGVQREGLFGGKARQFYLEVRPPGLTAAQSGVVQRCIHGHCVIE